MRALAYLVLIVATLVCGVVAIAFYTVIEQEHGTGFALGWAGVLLVLVWKSAPRAPQSPQRYLPVEREGSDRD
tara:strand:+ start:546 stop:764 length:219 start_codon:yes stop_codon:yes gene_type:complete